MRTCLTSMLCLLLIKCGAAQAAAPNRSGDDWNTVEHLAPGTVIEVQSAGGPWPQACRVSSVSDDSLICLTEKGAANLSLTLPRNEVRTVWVMERRHSRHLVNWCFIVVGTTIGVAALIVPSGGDGVGLGAGAGFGIAAAGLFDWHHDRRIQPRLIYTAAKP